MAFTSPGFLVFLVGVWAAHLVLPVRARRPWLLFASILFYWQHVAPVLVATLAWVVLTSFIAALRIRSSAGDRTKKLWFVLGVSANVVVLVGFKYGWEAHASLRSTLWLWQGQDTLQPFIAVGLSYYTLQAISYLADVYLGVAEPTTRLDLFALYLAFFPRVLQGPIERANDLLPALEKPYRYDEGLVRSAFLLLGWGAFKKLVVADRLAIPVDAIYGDLHAHGGLAILSGTYCYAFQLFCDFSGYTDMARGAARLFGIRLSQNFNAPYFATSIAEFWRRWHITLSRWILDYLFKPLQIRWRRLGNGGTALALFVAFAASGLWHGTGWNFVAWGVLHGTYLAASVYYRPIKAALDRRTGLGCSGVIRVWRAAFVFHMVLLAWVFFRAPTLGEAVFAVRRVVEQAPHDVAGVWARPVDGIVPVLFPGWGRKEFLLAVIGVSLVLGERHLRELRILERPLVVRWAAYGTLFLTVLILGVYGHGRFIYAKF